MVARYPPRVDWADIHIEDAEDFEICTSADYVFAGRVLEYLIKRGEPYSPRELELAMSLSRKIAAFPICNVRQLEKNIGRNSGQWRT